MIEDIKEKHEYLAYIVTMMEVIEKLAKAGKWVRKKLRKLFKPGKHERK